MSEKEIREGAWREMANWFEDRLGGTPLESLIEKGMDTFMGQRGMVAKKVKKAATPVQAYPPSYLPYSSDTLDELERSILSSPIPTRYDVDRMREIADMRRLQREHEERMSKATW